MAGLTLSRKIGEKIRIREDITLTVLDIHYRDGKPAVRLGLEAPREVSIHRGEVWRAIQRATEESDESKEQK